VLEKTGQELLRIKTPESLFSSDPSAAKKEFLLLAKRWHPDRNSEKESKLVFEHINDLFESAKRKQANGIWELPNILSLKDKKSKTHTIKYKKKSAFELGAMYVGDQYVTYEVTLKHKALFDNYVTTAKSFSYASDRMKTEVGRYLPHVAETIETNDNLYAVINKTEDLLLLRDVLEYFHGRMPVKQAMWIQSTLQNVLCYLQFAGLSHNDISLDTYFISPQYHSGALLGGWWYTTKYAKPMKIVPSRSYSFMSTITKTNKISSGALDSELIRAIGRELLGDKAGIGLAKNSGVPEPISSFLMSVAPNDHIQDYAAWRKALDKSFEKRYEKLALTSTDLYGP